MISKLQITLIFHKSNTSNNRSQFFVADVTKMASIFKKYLGAIFFFKKNVLLIFGIIFSKLNVYKCIYLRTVGVVACTLVSHPSDPGSIPTVENPFLLIVLG